MPVRRVLGPVTPAGHPLISLGLAVSVAGLATGALLLIFGGPGTAVLLVAAALFVATFAALLVRSRAVQRTIEEAREALDRGDVEHARILIAPLVDRSPDLPLVLNIAAEVLYESGDPLSAASFWERAMKHIDAGEIAPRLVAAYAALNRAGDARRVAVLAPRAMMTRLALAWSELVAIGGDRERGLVLAEELARDPGVRTTASEEAMALALEAIASSVRGDVSTARVEIARAEQRAQDIAPHDQAFIGYLCGVALRESGATDAARATFTAAMERAPESIGAALARRERSHLPER